MNVNKCLVFQFGTNKNLYYEMRDVKLKSIKNLGVGIVSNIKFSQKFIVAPNEANSCC